MSTADMKALMKEQADVAEFESSVLEAMEYVASSKGLLVGHKVEIIDQLRCVSKDTMFGFHIESGAMLRVPQSVNEKQYDLKTNNPLKLAERLVQNAKAK